MAFVQRFGMAVSLPMALALALAQPVHAAGPFASGQVWKGEYRCQQGDTKLSLRINKVAKAPTKTELGEALPIEAVFDFDYNNRSAAGAFRLAGNYYPESKVAIFDPKSWIRQPPGYEMVGLDGVVSGDGTSYSGKIVFPSAACTTFELALSAK